MKKIVIFLIAFIYITLCLPFFGCMPSGQKDPPNEEIQEGEDPPLPTEHTHVFDQQSIDEEYLKSKATFENKAQYYYSCICGEKGEDFFEYGEVRAPLTEEEKTKLKPTSLTVSVFDTTLEKGFVEYGFNWNTLLKPENQVIQIVEGRIGAGEDFPTTFDESVPLIEISSSFNDNGTTFMFYLSKVHVRLKENTVYTYRVYDKDTKVSSQTFVLRTCKPSTENAFTFSHFSDSQVPFGEEIDPEKYFRNVCSRVAWNSQFAIHTGDVVEYSKYESYWTRMLDGCSDYVTSLAIMPISGNHETTYQNGSNETYKHFYNNIPNNQNTYLGYYYSFTYSNAKFIMLNSNDLQANALKEDQYNWLVNELKNNDKEWLIVCIHNPLYSVGNYGSNPNSNSIARTLRNQLAKLFAENNVDIVLQGHDHCISKTHPIDDKLQPQTEVIRRINRTNYTVNPLGVIYAMNGTAGMQIKSVYEEYDESLYSIASQSNVSTWADITIDGSTLTVEVKSYGSQRDSTLYKWGIIKEN